LLCTDRLEQGNGGALVAAAKQLDPAPATLMVVTQPRRLMTIRLALEAGCDGLCLESRMGQGTVVQALTTVSTGAAYIDRSLHAQYFQSYPGLGDAPLARLSEREVQVLERVTSGKSNRVIAAELFLSVETVKSHLSRIAQKLQARDRVHAAVKGIRLGLVDWPEPR
jgi:DNA-binding NarL/FixJ family response regulator